MRRPLAAWAAVAAHLALAGLATGAEPAPIIYYWAAADAPPAAAEARAAVDELARRRGTAMIDRSPAGAEPPRAPALLRGAIEDYQGFRYDQALEKLERALAEAGLTGAAGLTPSELSDLLIYRALVQEQRGDKTRAWDDFLRAAVIDPSRRLDPVRFSPRIVESFARATAQVAAEAPVELTVEVAADCDVGIDGRGAAPGQPVPLRRGEHYLRAACAGMQPWAERAQVDAARTVRPALVAPRRPTDAELAADARRRGARMLIVITVASDAGPPTALLQLVDATSGKERSRAVLRVGRRGAVDIAAAAERMIDGVVRPVPIVGPQRPWYRSWQAWTVVGGGIAAGALAGFLIVRAVDQPTATDWNLSIAYPP
jgi:hypothetical protein